MVPNWYIALYKTDVYRIWWKSKRGIVELKLGVRSFK